MSHVAWADAQVMPFPSAQVRARAKAVLRSYAKYSDVTGRTWVTMAVLLVETDLGCPRTVRRGVADLKAAGFLEETGDAQVYMGKVYPIYQLPLDRGPKNTRERLRGCVADAGEDEADEPAVTPVSHQADPPENCCDTGVTSRGDTDDQLGVTPMSPKEKDNPHYVRVSELNGRAREAASRLADLERISPAAILRFYDRDAALAAMVALLGEAGLDLDSLPGAMRRMAGHPAFRSRKHPPQLHDWLAKRQFLGWLTDDAPAATAGKPADAASGGEPHAGSAPEEAQAIWRTALAEMTVHMGDEEFGAYLRPAFLGLAGGELYAVAITAIARQRIADRRWRQLQAAWTKADPRRRPLKLVSKLEFEALMRRQMEGVG